MRSPDYAVTKDGPTPLTIGYVEAKDIDGDLEAIERDSRRSEPSTANGNQFKRYRNSLSNLILTDYTEVPLVRGWRTPRDCPTRGARRQRKVGFQQGGHRGNRLTPRRFSPAKPRTGLQSPGSCEAHGPAPLT